MTIRDNLTLPAEAKYLNDQLIRGMPMFNYRHLFAAAAAVLLAACAGQPPALDPSTKKIGTYEAQVWGTGAIGTLDVWLLDVGQGSCTFIACPDKRSALLIDCGSSAAGGTPLAAVRDWLNTKMADMPTTVVVSHPDKDHMSLLTVDGVIAEQVTALLVGRTLEHYPPAFRSWAEKVRSAPQGFGAAEVAISDARFSCHPAEVDVLTANATLDPQSGEFGSSKNADSAVIRVRFGESSVIVTGDAEGDTEQSALDNAASQQVSLIGTSLLLGSHHGARTHGSNGQAWIEGTRPKAVAYSARLASSYHHPQCEAIERAAVVADPAAEEFEFTCGLGNAAISAQRVRNRILSTHINGHVLARMGATEIRYLCQYMSPACDEPVDPTMFPR